MKHGLRGRKILCLGGSTQQVVAIEAAKQLGCHTVLIDYLPDNPGQYIADKFYQESTTDIEAVYRIAKDEKVDGILAYASDPAAFPAAIVAERLGLPTNPAKSVEILGVKHKFREFLSFHGFASPQYKIFPSDIDLDSLKGTLRKFKFPIVVKPTDSSGSKGVSVLNSIDTLGEALEYADHYSRNRVLIAEEFIERGFPDVIGGDIFVWDGQIILHGEMACLRGDKGKGLVPIGEKKPNGLNNQQNRRIKSELQRLVAELGVRSGELNVEIILDKNDNVYFLEVGPRAGGNMIPIQLSDAFGVDLVKANVQVALGKVPDLTIHEQKGCFVTYVLHSYQPGSFDRIDYAFEIKPYIYRDVIYKQPGDIVECFDGARKAVGIVFMRFDTETQMRNFCPQLESLIKVVVK